MIVDAIISNTNQDARAFWKKCFTEKDEILEAVKWKVRAFYPPRFLALAPTPRLTCASLDFHSGAGHLLQDRVPPGFCH